MDWRQAIIRTNAGIWLIGRLETHLSEILIEILTFWKKMHLKVLWAKWGSFCLGPNVLIAVEKLADRYHFESRCQSLI